VWVARFWLDWRGHILIEACATAGKGHLDVVRYLLDNNANLAAQSISLYTPLHSASQVS